MTSLSIVFILNGVFFISLFLLKNISISLTLTVFSFFLLLFIPRPKKTGTANTTSRFLNLNFKNTHYSITVVCLIIFVVLEYFIGFNAALFTVFFIFSYFNRLDSRISLVIGLTLLALTALLSRGDNTQGTEKIALFAYYFLLIFAIWQIIELLKEKLAEKINLDYNFFTKKNVIITSIFIIFVSVIALYIMHSKSKIGKNTTITSTNISIITPSYQPLQHVSLTILNGTDIQGLASSTAALLRKSGWEKEFNISIGNYTGSVSANILKYTENLKDKKKILEQDLRIRITPVILNNASSEAEMILILGK